MPTTRLVVFAKAASKKPSIAVGERGIVIAVREPAHGGQANEACRRALCDAIGVAPSRVTLVHGARSKTKLFEIADITQEAVEARLSASS